VHKPDAGQKGVRVVGHELLERLVRVHASRFERHNSQLTRAPQDDWAVVQLRPSFLGNVRNEGVGFVGFAGTNHLVVRAVDRRHCKEPAVDAGHGPGGSMDKVQHAFARGRHERLGSPPMTSASFVRPKVPSLNVTGASWISPRNTPSAPRERHRRGRSKPFRFAFECNVRRT